MLNQTDDDEPHEKNGIHEEADSDFDSLSDHTLKFHLNEDSLKEQPRFRNSPRR